MVRILQRASAVLQLIRWKNLVIIALTQVLLRMLVLQPLLQKANMELQLSTSLFLLMVIATVCIAAGGYAINDYFDRKIDLINKPGSLVVGRQIYPRHAMVWHLIFTISGIMLGTFVSYRIGEIYLSIVFFMTSGLLWFYSTTYKKQLLLGNIIVAAFTGGVPFLVLLFELPLLAHNYGSDAAPISRHLMTWVLGFSAFAFLLNLIREIIKDTEDFEGDKAYGKQTVPIVWGIRTVRIITLAIIATIIGILVAAWLFFVRDNITLIYFTFAIVVPLMICSVLIFRADRQKQWHDISLLLKGIMIAGLVYMAIVKLIILQFE